jgi:hypothetical protein
MTFLSNPAIRNGGAWGDRTYSSYKLTTSALDGVAPRQRFSPGERTPGTHCTGGWVGLRATLDTEVTEKSFAPAGDQTPIARPSSP